METRIRMRAARARGLNTNSVSPTRGLAGGRTMWHARFTQFPTPHQVDGFEEAPRMLLVAGTAFAAGWFLCKAKRRGRRG